MDITIISKNVEKQVDALVAEGKTFEEAVKIILGYSDSVEIPTDPVIPDTGSDDIFEELPDTGSSEDNGFFIDEDI